MILSLHVRTVAKAVLEPQRRKRKVVLTSFIEVENLMKTVKYGKQ